MIPSTFPKKSGPIGKSQNRKNSVPTGPQLKTYYATSTTSTKFKFWIHPPKTFGSVKPEPQTPGSKRIEPPRLAHSLQHVSFQEHTVQLDLQPDQDRPTEVMVHQNHKGRIIRAYTCHGECPRS